MKEVVRLANTDFNLNYIIEPSDVTKRKQPLCKASMLFMCAD